MKRTIAQMSIMLIILATSHNPQALCQEDTMRTRHVRQQTTNDDADSEDDVPQPSHTKKKTSGNIEAPVAFGIDGGVNGSALVIGGNTSTEKDGIRFGGIMDVRLVGVLHLELGLFYAMTGGGNIDYIDRYNGQYISRGYTWNVNTIELPINLEFKFGKPGHAHFFFGVGGYVGYNVSGTISPSDVNNGVLKIGSSDADDLKALDLGIALNIGFQLKDGLFFRIRSQGGLSNLEPKDPSIGNYSTTIRTSSYGLEIGYLFSNKPKHVHRKTKDDDYIERKM